MKTSEPEIVAYMESVYGEVAPQQAYVEWEHIASKHSDTDYRNYFKDKTLEYTEPLVRLSDYKALQAKFKELVVDLELGFPLLDDEGLDEDEHHCEWVIQRERKRVHNILESHRKGEES